MIYGINFGAPPIPDGIKKKFALRQKFPDMGRGEYAILSGVGQSPGERDAMVIQANNGHRKVFIVERKTAGGLWFGIYTY